MSLETLKQKAQKAGLVVKDAGVKTLAVQQQGLVPLGIEGMDDRDAQIPRLTLFNEKNKVMLRMQAKKIAGAVPGAFCNSANEELPLQSVEFVPGFMTKFWDLVKWKGEEKEWLARTFDTNDPILTGKRRKQETRKLEDGSEVTLKAEVQEVITVVAVIDNFPTVINFKSTSYATGKDLYTKARKSGLPLWGQKYKLTSKYVEAKNPYYVMVVDLVGPSSEEEQATAQQLYESFKGKAQKLNPAAGAAADEEAPF